MNQNKVYAAIVLSVVLNACGLVDPDPIRPERLPELETFTPPTDRPYYNGPDEPLTLSEDNWLQITWAVYQISSVMDRVAGAYGSSGFRSPRYLSTQPTEPFFPKQCEAGSVAMKTHEDYPQVVESYIYDRCVVGDREITGLHLYSEPGVTSVRGIEAWVGDVLIETPDDELTYHSILKLRDSSIQPASTSSFGLYSLRLNQTFIGEDMTLAYNGIRGRLYVNNQGYLEIPEKSTSEAITLEGANGIALFIFFGDLEEGKIRLSLKDGPIDLQVTEVDTSILTTAPIPH